MSLLLNLLVMCAYRNLETCKHCTETLHLILLNKWCFEAGHSQDGAEVKLLQCINSFFFPFYKIN